ncbi:MAG: WYL domain-containing protein, partial [Defluviitaleaceae bacterium]|nr:WYL domain-containing protein [Defluviitaleaceae bacterium]
IKTSRYTIVRELEQLTESGLDTICNPGKPNQYFIGERHFELPELKLLVDAVMASRFIPPKKADTLVKKLSGFASIHQSGELHRSLYTDKQPRPVSDKAYITVDLLHTAESTGKKIICKYFEWDADKKKVYKHGRQDYQFSPYGLIWNNDRYYTVGWSDSHGKIITLRIDRIAAPKLTGIPAEPRPKDFDMAFYADTVINMYDGSVVDVTLHCKNAMMKHIIDRFGEDVETKIVDEEHFAAFVSVPTSPTFFAWVFTFEGSIKITAPNDVVESYRNMLRAAMD